MKKLLFLFLIFVAPVLAQNPTLVTGTITDPNGVAWYPGTVTATLSPATAINPTVNGQRINTNSDNTQMRVMTSTNPDGSFSMSLFPNAAITPGGTQWVFFVYTNGSGQPAGLGPKNFTVAITIAGASQDVGPTLRAAAPLLLGAGGGGGGSVASVFTRTGAVVAQANDYSFSQLSGSIGLVQTPLTTTQDILFNNAGALGRLPIVTSGQCLGNTGGVWASLACSGGGGAVTSVFGRTGVVVSAANDYSFTQLSGSLAHAQLPVLLSADIPNNAANTSGLAGTATALATLPTKCSAGNYPLGVDVSGNAQNCTAAGGGSGTITSGTTNILSKYTAATTIGNSLLSDSGTLLSYTGTGGISSTSDGVHPGNLSLVGNTTVVAPATNTFNIMGPSVTTFTAYALQYPSTGPSAAGISHVGAPSSGVSQLTFSPIVAADITNNTVTDTQLSTTGATAASCGDTTHSCSLTITTAGRITANSNNVIAGGGGGGGAAGSFAQAFTAQTSVTITGATHTLGTANILVGVYDGATPANVILPANVTVDPSTFNVVVTFNSSQTGTIVLVAGASKYIAAFGSTTSLSVTAATHKLGASIFHVTVYDASSGTRNRIEPGNLAIDASGNVTVAFAVAQAGQIVIE